MAGFFRNTAGISAVAEGSRSGFRRRRRVTRKFCPPRRVRRRPREMKESILDVLLYLFEHYFTEDADLVRDHDSLRSGPLFEELGQAGFSAAEINKAFEWLDALASQRPSVATPRADGPTRVYFGPELDKLDVE